MGKLLARMLFFNTPKNLAASVITPIIKAAEVIDADSRLMNFLIISGGIIPDLTFLFYIILTGLTKRKGAGSLI